LLPGVVRAVAALRRADLLALVVTNQPELSRGGLHAAELERMHTALAREVEFDGIYVCPHDDADGCLCRKPRPGLLITAAEQWGVSLRDSFLIGDSQKDIAAGSAAGCRTILVGERAAAPTRRKARAHTRNPKPHARAANLADAAALILADLGIGPNPLDRATTVPEAHP
jgi:D-glycero-D-manno-heptose 1,7-bisphosphate phosphatase